MFIGFKYINTYETSLSIVEDQFCIYYFMYRCYGSGQSLSGWDRARRALSFETKETAIKRKLDELCDQTSKRTKRHTGNFDKISWDGETLKAELLSYEDGQHINWRELARKYDIKNNAGQLAKNGGQIIKEWLLSEDVDIERFTTKSKSEDSLVIRRKRKTIGGEISTPIEVDQNELRRKLKEKLLNKESTIGNMIVPRQVNFIKENKILCFA